LRPVAFVVVPIFAFANAGVSFEGLGLDTLMAPVTLGVASGLVLGKFFGVFGAVWIIVRTGVADLPAGASWMQMLGVAILCGIGFTMSLFISLLALDSAFMQTEAKFGILAGSLMAGILGYLVLRLAQTRQSSKLTDA
jgi:NhaA family Na+:H+ antiporter